MQQLVPRQTWPAAHCCGQPTFCPQLFVTLTPPQRPLHAAPLSLQHVPSGLQIAPDAAHAPPLPHATVCPQLLIAVPHDLPAHVVATGSGTQPQLLFVHVPPSQPPQSTGRPQLSCVCPHRLLHHDPSETHSQLPVTHALPAPQSSEHARGLLQLSSVVPHRSAHVTAFGSGVHELVTPPSPSVTTAPSGPIVPGGLVDPSRPSPGPARRALSKSTPAIVSHPAPAAMLAIAMQAAITSLMLREPLCAGTIDIVVPPSTEHLPAQDGESHFVSSAAVSRRPRHGHRPTAVRVIACSDGKLPALGTETRHLAEGRVGTLLDGKWSLDALLGYGGSAAVYAATHRNGKRAAIKVLHPHYVADENLRSRFTREGYLANKIEHPGAVSVLDDDVADDGTVFLVMELLEGTSLEKIGRGEAPPLTMAEVVRITDDLLDVLAKAHALGIVHRDIKPANLFVTTSGRLKVLDFGIARLAEAKSDGSAVTQTGFMMGTPAFMPPEQARGRWAEVDARSDLFAAGATMIALLTGRRPRHADTANEELLAAMTVPFAPVSALVPSLPAALAAVIDRAVAFNRDERWPTAQAMQQALRDAARESEATLDAPATLIGSAAVGPPIVTSTLVAPVSGARSGSHPAPPASIEPPPSLTTSRAVLHSAAPPGPPKKSAAAAIAVALGVVLVVGLLVAVGGLYVRSRGGLGMRAAAPATSSPTTEPKAPPSAATAPPIEQTPSSVVVAPTEPAPATETGSPSVDTPSAAPPEGSASAATKPARPAPSARPQASASANPAKYFDSRF